MARIEWKGKQVLAEMAAAATVGVDKTMGECVSTAKREHPYEDQTGFETGSIAVGEHAKAEGMKVSGTWGGYSNYSLFLEIGTSRIGATAQERAQEGGGNMWAIPDVKPGLGEPVRQAFTIVPLGDGEFITRHVPRVMRGNPGLVAPRPFLRPSADKNYRKLSGYIRAAYEAG